MTTITISIRRLDSASVWLIDQPDVPAFKELIQRGANLWPDAPPEIKAFADWITNGKIMQDYHAQAGTQDKNKLTRAGSEPWTAVDAEIAALNRITTEIRAGIELAAGLTSAETAEMIARETYMREALGFAANTQTTPAPPKPARITHSEMVRKTKKDPHVINLDLSDIKVDLIHMVIGISGEAGELLDAIKKNAVYGKELNIDNVIEELGDLEYYLEGLRQALKLDRQQILDANVTKLAKRYKDFEYSDAQAISRNDKIGDTIAAFKAKHIDTE